MVDPNLPQSQIDALPIRTVSAAAQGELITVGSSISRYWAPAVLGMPAIFAVVGTSNVALSAPIDVTGCTVFVLIMSRTILIAAGDVANTYQLFVTYQFTDGTDVDFANFPGANQNVAARQCPVPILGGATPRTDVFTLAWSSNVLMGGGGGNALATVGRRVRILVVGGGTNPANQSYSFEMWGTQSG